MNVTYDVKVLKLGSLLEASVVRIGYINHDSGMEDDDTDGMEDDDMDGMDNTQNDNDAEGIRE